MPFYNYRAKDPQGYIHKGSFEAENVQEVLKSLGKRNLTTIDIKEKAAWIFKLKSISKFNLSRKIKSRDYMIFCRQFATMYLAGFTILKSLQVVSKQVENNVMAEKLREVSLEVEKGNSLAASLEKYPAVFPPMMNGMVAAGELGGILGEVLKRLAEHYERQSDLEEKIRGAMTYPLIISAVALLVLGVMIFFVLPTFGEAILAMGVEIPGITLAIMDLGVVIANYWILFLLVGMGIVVVWKPFFDANCGKVLVEWLKLKMPVLAPIYRKVIAFRFSRNLGSLISSGIDLLAALELLENILGHRDYTAALNASREDLSRGWPMSVSLKKSGLFPLLLTEMIRVGEETGQLDEMLDRAADYYEREVTYAVNRLGIIIEPVILILVGILVGLLVASLIIPMFQIYEGI